MKVMPKGLTQVTILLCIFNLMGFGGLTLYDRTSEHYSLLVVFTFLVIGASFVVLWFFRKGKGWARMLVLIACLFALTNLFYLSVYPWIHRCVVFLQAFLACCLIIWLHTKEVKAYFTNE